MIYGIKTELPDENLLVTWDLQTEVTTHDLPNGQGESKQTTYHVNQLVSIEYLFLDKIGIDILRSFQDLEGDAKKEAYNHLQAALIGSIQNKSIGQIAAFGAVGGIKSY